MAGLLDFIQGASNSAAGTISGPVDLINMGLLGIGMPMPNNPFGGSQWMRERGLIRDPQNRAMGLLGEAAGNILPIVAAAKAPQIANGLLQMGENMRAPTPMNTATRGQAGAIVYHGSPHKFDKFDSSKIGTGEGAQAYGHGLYFAENPNVAQEYQRTLSKYAPQIDGKSVFESYANGTLAPQLVSKAGLSRGNAVEAAHWLGEAARTNRPIAQIVEERAAFGMELLGADEAARIRALGAKVAGVSQGGTVGHLYKVDLPDEHIAKMLDWDKPLSQQAPDVQRALMNLPTSHKLSSEMTGAQLYESTHLVPGISADKRNAAERLKALGIPGVRYLDGGSRGAGTGTSNYVVFPGNEGLLSILGRE